MAKNMREIHKSLSVGTYLEYSYCYNYYTIVSISHVQVRLSPEDLASQELALWRKRETKHQLDMIKKSELELLNCNRQYVFKTHKGM